MYPVNFAVFICCRIRSDWNRRNLLARKFEFELDLGLARAVFFYRQIAHFPVFFFFAEKFSSVMGKGRPARNGVAVQWIRVLCAVVSKNEFRRVFFHFNDLKKDLRKSLTLPKTTFASTFFAVSPLEVLHCKLPVVLPENLWPEPIGFGDRNSTASVIQSSSCIFFSQLTIFFFRSSYFLINELIQDSITICFRASRSSAWRLLYLHVVSL